MKHIKGSGPFAGYKIYGPILHRKMGRKMICLVSEDNSSRTTITYAKYLLSVHLGRWLTRKEEVDHINNDKADDRLENLQILTRPENVEKSTVRGRTMVDLVCPQCNKTFTKERRATHLVKGGTRTFCSRNCLYTFQRKT